MQRWLIPSVLLVAGLIIGFLAIQGQSQSQQPVPGWPAKEKEKRTINTSGTATVRVKPDSARVFFGVQTMDKTIKEAREENGVRVKRVIDALRALNIPDLKMKTSDVQVELVQSHRSHDQLPVIVGYRVTNTFTVLVNHEDPERLGAMASRILDTALENGANVVQHVTFFKQDMNEARRQALVRAVQDAESNARALAEGARVGVQETITIQGQPQYYYAPYHHMTNTAQVAIGGGAETPVVAGDLEVTCTVSVTCTY